MESEQMHFCLWFLLSLYSLVTPMSFPFSEVDNGPMVIFSHKHSFNSLLTMSRAMQSQNSKHNLTSNLSCLKSEILNLSCFSLKPPVGSGNKLISFSSFMFSTHHLPRVKCSVGEGRAKRMRYCLFG